MSARVRDAGGAGGAGAAGADAGARPVVLHVAPHPDDELIGAPATLMVMRDAGWRVVNLTCSLGAPADRDRRRRELEDACRRARFECEVIANPLDDPLASGDLVEARRRLTTEVVDALERHRPRLVVAPSPHDRHRGHEVVGRAVVSACAADADADADADAGADAPGQGDGGPATARAPERLWLWGLWADLPFPTLAVRFDETHMAEILDALSAHAGEMARNDYRRLVRGRAEMNASLGPERVFGFGTAASQSDTTYVEVLTELGRRGGHWHLGARRWLDPLAPTAELGDGVIDAWLEEASLTDRFGAPE
jgi:LmbE family N-acetylglucosaminyl deacetylase